jgi:hypothetical protein
VQFVVPAYPGDGVLTLGAPGGRIVAGDTAGTLIVEETSGKVTVG